MNPDIGQVIAALLAVLVSALVGYGIGYRRGREDEYRLSAETVWRLAAERDVLRDSNRLLRRRVIRDRERAS